MRTHIVINDDLMAEAMSVTGISTKRGVVEKALQLLVSTSKQNALLALRGNINWEGNLDEMRQGRFIYEEQGSYTVGGADISEGRTSAEEDYVVDEEIEVPSETIYAQGKQQEVAISETQSTNETHIARGMDEKQ